MNKAILSVKDPKYAERLREYGYEIIPSDIISCEMPYERDHADLQCLIIDDTAFVLSSCDRLINALSDDYQIKTCGTRFGESYPDNVCLSALLCGDLLICREASLDSAVKSYAHSHDYQILNVNQGYAKCACAQVSDRAVITSDKGIINALKDTEIDVLTIGKGSVHLSGAEYGFIGGASGYDRNKNKLYFCGNIQLHPDYNTIKAFCDQHQTAIICLSDDPVTDIGGIVFC